MATEDEAAVTATVRKWLEHRKQGWPITPRLAPNNPLPPSTSLTKVTQPPKTVPLPGDQMLEHLHPWGHFIFYQVTSYYHLSNFSMPHLVKTKASSMASKSVHALSPPCFSVSSRVPSTFIVTFQLYSLVLQRSCLLPSPGLLHVFLFLGRFFCGSCPCSTHLLSTIFFILK